MRTAAASACLLAAAVALGACSSQSARSERFDYQLGGAYDTSAGLDVVVRDSTAQPMAGTYSICYVNGFQTQPESNWDRKLLLRGENGTLVTDPQWPDEYILDPATADNRAGILDVLGPVLDHCAAQGFSAVEIDNLDVWTRFPELVDESSVLELARLYADRVHASGMEIAQKNAPDGAARIRANVGFDFAVAESCIAYDECGSYTDAYGTRVYDIEYTDDLESTDDVGSFESICADAQRPPVTILRDRGLVASDDPDHVYRQC